LEALIPMTYHKAMPEDPKPDWKDFLALVIAVYQLVLPPILIILFATAAVLFLMQRLG